MNEKDYTKIFDIFLANICIEVHLGILWHFRRIVFRLSSIQQTH